MAGAWQSLMFVLLLAPAPRSGRADMPVAEVPDAHGQARSPQGESPAGVEEGEPAAPGYSSCMFRCMNHTLHDMLRSLLTAQARRSLMLNEGREGEEHEFCWLLRLRSQKEERLTKAFVLLNPEPLPNGGQPPSYRILVTVPSSVRRYVQAQPKKRVIRLLNGEACGVRYDVTMPFRTAEDGGPDAQMCIKAVCLDEDLCRALRLGMQCPPFLATLWRSLPRPDG